MEIVLGVCCVRVGSVGSVFISVLHVGAEVVSAVVCGSLVYLPPRIVARGGTNWGLHSIGQGGFDLNVHFANCEMRIAK